MKRTLEERVKFKLLHIGRRNRVLGFMIMPVLLLCMSFFFCCKYFKGNIKRFSMMAMSFVLFTVYSSFSFPMFISESNTQHQGLYVEGAEDVALAQETELNLEEVELLDDKDVLEDFEYGETSHGYAIVDIYGAEEILEMNGVLTDDLEEEQPDAEQEPIEEYNFSKDDWRLVLINKQHSVPDDYEVKLGTIHTLKGPMQCDERIIEDWLSMFQDAKKAGVVLGVCSPYRDLEYQEMLFNRKMKRYMGMGMSYMEAFQLSSQVVTVPGASEHQIGLALDIVCSTYTSLDEGFGETEAGKWLAENSCNYGFILRYPLGKEYITGIDYEPWHFRYVGKEAATLIMEQGITLEEFWEEYL